MKKIGLALIGLVSVVIAVIAVVGLSYNMNETSVNSILPVTTLELDFRYVEANYKLREVMDSNGISMSNPILLEEKKEIERYCSFFEDEQKQKLVEFCTSTELLNSEGEFLGNIHMIGSKAFPKLVIVLIQTDPFNSDLPEVKSIFRLVTETLVCYCWNDEKPDGFATIDAWVDGLLKFHLSDVKPHSQSKSIPLEGKKLQLELTTNFEGYLWELLIARK